MIFLLVSLEYVLFFLVSCLVLSKPTDWKEICIDKNCSGETKRWEGEAIILGEVLFHRIFSIFSIKYPLKFWFVSVVIDLNCEIFFHLVGGILCHAKCHIYGKVVFVSNLESNKWSQYASIGYPIDTKRKSNWTTKGEIFYFNFTSDVQSIPF